MRLLICGDRHWTDEAFIYDKMANFGPDVIIIHGDAPGADTCADNAAQWIGLSVLRFPALWQTYGKAAGPKRNQRMLDAEPDEVWAFHDNLSQSKGTVDMIRRAKKAGIPVTVFSHGG